MTGRQLKAKREALGLSQIEFATRLGYSHQWIQANEQKGNGHIAPGLEATIKKHWVKVAK